MNLSLHYQSYTHPQCRPITSRTKHLWWLVPVVLIASTASMILCSAVSVPIVMSVPQKSLSIDPTIPTMLRWACVTFCLTVISPTTRTNGYIMGNVMRWQSWSAFRVCWAIVQVFIGVIVFYNGKSNDSSLYGLISWYWFIVIGQLCMLICPIYCHYRDGKDVLEWALRLFWSQWAERAQEYTYI